MSSSSRRVTSGLSEQADCTQTTWWRADGALERFLVDLLMSEAKFLRPGGPLPPVAAFREDAALGEAGLGFDSLECLAMAAALSEAHFLHEGGLDDSLVVNTDLGSWRNAALAALGRLSARVCFRSSGSTGLRQRCVHDMTSLEEEVAFFASELVGRRRVVVALPCHHIYGFLFSLMLPARLEVSVLDVRNRFPPSVAAALRSGDLVIGHPGFWSELTRAAPSGWPTDVVGVTSGAPCPDEVAEAARDAGLARLLQVYGSSETAGIGWRDEPSAPYKLLPFWQTTDGGLRLKRAGKREVEAPDCLRWLDMDNFFLEGRRDAAAQVGGMNVYPGRVRDVLCDHPAVSEAAVRLMTLNEGGRLKAFVVPHDLTSPHEVLRRDLHAHVEARLSVAERPRAFTFGSLLPMTAAGKPADWTI